MEPMHFDLASPQEIPVTVGEDRYTLKEASSEAACKWRNFCARQTRFTNTNGQMQVVSMGDLADAEPYLVALCLFHEQPDAKGKKRMVSLDTIKSWPSRIVKQLFERAKEMSDLVEAENPHRKLLQEALERGDGPTTLYLFREWVETLAKEEVKYKPLCELVKPDKEDEAKN